MGEWVLREPSEETNPTLPGGIYGKYITAGRLVYWSYDGAQTRFILFIGDGGLYGLDSVSELQYNGNVLAQTVSSVPQWEFKRGTITAQIVPFLVSSVDYTGNAFTLNAHIFINGDRVRLKASNGTMPGNTASGTKYFIVNKTANTFQISLTENGTAVDLTTVGTGVLRVWKANTGFDDPLQGLNSFCPEVATTFNNIGYIAGKLPAGISQNELPNNSLFRVVGVGRRLMDYNAEGAPLGILTNANGFLSNPALQIPDVILNSLKRPISRIGWVSLTALKTSAMVDVWHRTQSNPNFNGQGLTGKYYNFPTTTDFSFAGLLPDLVRTDPTIDFNWGDGSPVAGINANYFGVIWEGKIKPEFSETYTFSSVHDNGARLYIDGSLIFENWTETVGTDSGQITLEANRLYSIRLEYFESFGLASIFLKWQSASQALDFIPSARLYPSDSPSKRYESHLAFPSATESTEVFEIILERCPGWHWTDRNGKIEFLSPERLIEYEFVFDVIDFSLEATFTAESFTRIKRPRKDRKNFILRYFRNVEETGYPKAYAEADRPNLRELRGGQPDNDSPTNLGVMSGSLAERILELEMILKSDPLFVNSLNGDRSATKLNKGMLAKIFYYRDNNVKIADEVCLITAAKRGGNKTGESIFTLLPITLPFYTDEIYTAPVVPIYDADTTAYMNALVIANNSTVYFSGTPQERTGAQLWTAVDALVVSLKTASLWTRFYVICLFLGGTAARHKLNLKNPLDTDGAFRLAFSGGWTHSATGSLPNGTDGYARTFFNPFVNFTTTSGSMFLYSRTNNAVHGYDLGVAISVAHVIICRYFNQRTHLNFGEGYYHATPEVSGAGRFGCVRNDGLTTKGYRNAVEIMSNNHNVTLQNSDFYLGATNVGGSPAYFAGKEYCELMFGTGFSAAEVTAINTIFNTFETALNRQV